MKHFLPLVALLFCFQSFGQANGWEWQNPKPTGNNLMDLHVFDAQKVMGIGAFGTVILTDNGGNSWTKIGVGTKQLLRELHFSDNLNGWIVGDSGIILKTSNGGINWFHQTSNISLSLK